MGVFRIVAAAGEAGSLRLGIATIVIALVIYKFIQTRRDNEVSFAFLFFFFILTHNIYLS